MKRNFNILALLLICHLLWIPMTQIYAQSPKLLTSGGQLINFTNSSAISIENLPMSPLCGYSSPIHDESLLCSLLVISEDNDIESQLYYYGQHPVYCQSIQTDEKGNVLFFIIDNNIYNRYGESFKNIHQQNLYSQKHYWLHQLPIWADETEFTGEFINRLYVIDNAELTENNKILGQELAIIPVPQEINNFYLIYSIDEHFHLGGVNRDHTFYYRKLSYFSDNEITISTPSPISTLEYCSENLRMNMAISNYRSDQFNYLLFISNGYGNLEVYTIATSGINVNNQAEYSYYGVGNYQKGYNTNEIELKYFSNLNLYKLAVIQSGSYPYVSVLDFPYDYSSYTTSYVPPLKQIEIWNGPPISKITGLEFSPNGNFLFMTHSNQSELSYFDFSLDSTFEISYITNHDISNISRSWIELGQDGKLYFQEYQSNNTGNLIVLNNPNNPSNPNWSSYPILTYYQQFYNIYSQQDRFNSYSLQFQDQIDGWSVSDFIDDGIGCVFPICTNRPFTNGIWTQGANNNPFNIVGDIYIDDTLIIPENTTIQINDLTLRLTHPSKIFLEHGTTHNGAELHINNSTLTSFEKECREDSLWWGFELRGVGGNTPQGTPGNSSQPFLSITNSNIKNARNAVSISGGGILQASNTNFVNNKRSIEFLIHHNKINSTSILPNLSQLFDCDFVVNDDFITTYQNENFKNHVTLWDVEGVKFIGCRFSNEQTTNYYTTKDRNMGIFSLDAGYQIKQGCTSFIEIGGECPVNDIIESSFKGLYIGVHAISGVNNSSDYLLVYQSLFEQNAIGVQLNGQNSANVIRSIFKDINNPAMPNYLYETGGIWAVNSSGYRIEGNSINNSTSGRTTDWGIYINESGPDANELFKNNIKKSKYAITLNGKNSDQSDEYKGLQVLCNNIDSTNQHDLIIGTGGGNNSIAKYQGVELNGQILPAGNKFTIGFQEDPYNYACFGSPVTYYYSNQTREEPLKLIGYVTKELLTTVNSCPSKLETEYFPDLDFPGVPLVKAQYHHYDTAYANLYYSYMEMIDDGNTPLLLAQIQSTWPQDAWDLRNDLMQIAPFVSREALLETAFQGILPEAMLLEVCIANPQATADDEFLHALEFEIPSPLPAYMIDLIHENWDAENSRTLIERNLSFYASNRDRNFNYWMLHNKLGVCSIDTLTQMHEYKAELSNQLDLIALNFEKGEYEECESLINNLLAIYDQVEMQEGLYSLNELVNLLRDVELDSRNIMNLTVDEHVQLQNIANINALYASHKAQNILCFVYGECPDLAPIIDTSQVKRTTSRNNRNSGKPDIKLVEVTPNPANNHIQLVIQPPIDEGYFIKIVDVNGKIYLERFLHSYESVWNLDCKEYPNGVYFYQLTNKNGNYESGKFVISH